jgi:hypothetical protein
MPKSVDEVRFMIDCVRLIDPESEAAGAEALDALEAEALGFGESNLVCSKSGRGLGEDELSDGGVGLMKLTSKGRRGMGLTRRGPSSDMVGSVCRHDRGGKDRNAATPMATASFGGAVCSKGMK